MTYTEQLEREAEETRQALAGTLDELKTRITPGNVVDQLVDYAQDGGGAEFFRNLKRQTVANPLPVTLIGAGLAWLMVAGGRTSATRASDHQSRPSDYDRTSDYAEMGPDMLGYRPDGEAPDEASAGVGSTLAEKARSTTGAVGDAAADVRDRASSAASSAMGSLKDTVGSVREGASSTYGAAARAYAGATDTAARTASSMADSARQMGHGAMTTSRSFVDFCREQPLLLAGLGVALGAALGAMLPNTETEDRLMGEASDSAKEGMREGAAQAYDKMAAVGERAAEAAQEAAKDEADKQGLTQTSDLGGAAAAAMGMQGTKSEQGKSEGAKAEPAKSEQSLSDRMKSDERTPDQSKPGEARPDETKSALAKPSRTAANPMNPARPGEMKPSQPKADDLSAPPVPPEGGGQWSRPGTSGPAGRS